MHGSSFGNLFRITTWGESHGKAIGVTVDGCPAGLELSEADIQPYLNRRKPGQSIYATPRKEDDGVSILSGIFEGKTTGTPISMIVPNTSARSKDYSDIAGYYRPGHADYTFDAKYGFRDYRGGGRSPGRETIGRVAAGAIAAKALSRLGIVCQAWTRSIGPICLSQDPEDLSACMDNRLYMPDPDAAIQAETLLTEKMADHDSVGGTIRCRIRGVPAGIGDPVFEKLDARLAHAMMSIGAVKGVEIGDGFDAALACGSENNDPFCIVDGKPAKQSNHAGGILGGISDGSDILLTVAVKPTPSIFQVQHTIGKNMTEMDIQIKGRHDPIIVPRAVVVVECMAALTVFDALLANMTARMDYVEQLYKN